jgi:HK97 family phage portal protein
VTLAAAPAWSLGRQVTSRSSDGSLIPPPSFASLFGQPGPYVYDTQSARRIPAVGRALALYGGMCKQMPIDAYRAGQPLPRPSLLRRPDPTNARSWFVEVNVQDYLLNGNAIAYVTSRGVDGWPLSVVWLPATWVYITWWPGDLSSAMYTYLGNTLDPDDVIHVKRGADRYYPVRGVGVVEEYMSTLDRVAMEEEYERSTLAGSSVPSVAIITPQATLTTDVADAAKVAWKDKFGGPTREPAVLPNGTQVIPLAWSPSDTQLIEARKASLTDVANMFNLDSYWLGAAVQGMTYKTAAPQYQQILRTSIEPVLADFEDVWSDALLPRGTSIRFDRNQLLRDDMPTTATALATLVGSGIISAQEARAYMALPISGGPAVEPQQIAPDTAGQPGGTDLTGGVP